MRTSILCLVLAACGGAPRTGPVPIIVEAAPVPAGQPQPTAVTQDRTGPRAEILRELELVDLEIDAIDDEIAEAATRKAQTRDEAVIATRYKIAQVQAAAPNRVDGTTPALLARLAADHARLLARDAELAVDLGPKHADRLALHEEIAASLTAFHRQQATEIAVLQAYRDRLEKLPGTTPAGAIEHARVSVLHDYLNKLPDDHVPSDVRAELRIAAIRVYDLLRTRANAARVLGDKNPDLIELDSRLHGARATLRVVVLDTLKPLERSMLDHRTPVTTIEPARLARRAALAARARDLRRQWDALR